MQQPALGLLLELSAGLPQGLQGLPVGNSGASRNLDLRAGRTRKGGQAAPQHLNLDRSQEELESVPERYREFVSILQRLQGRVGSHKHLVECIQACLLQLLSDEVAHPHLLLKVLDIAEACRHQDGLKDLPEVVFWDHAILTAFHEKLICEHVTWELHRSGQHNAYSGIPYELLAFKASVTNQPVNDGQYNVDAAHGNETYRYSVPAPDGRFSLSTGSSALETAIAVALQHGSGGVTQQARSLGTSGSIKIKHQPSGTVNNLPNQPPAGTHPGSFDFTDILRRKQSETSSDSSRGPGASNNNNTAQHHAAAPGLQSPNPSVASPVMRTRAPRPAAVGPIVRPLTHMVTERLNELLQARDSSERVSMGTQLWRSLAKYAMTHCLYNPSLKQYLSAPRKEAPSAHDLLLEKLRIVSVLVDEEQIDHNTAMRLASATMRLWEPELWVPNPRVRYSPYPPHHLTSAQIYGPCVRPKPKDDKRGTRVTPDWQYRQPELEITGIKLPRHVAVAVSQPCGDLFQRLMSQLARPGQPMVAPPPMAAGSQQNMGASGGQAPQAAAAHRGQPGQGMLGARPGSSALGMPTTNQLTQSNNTTAGPSQYLGLAFEDGDEPPHTQGLMLTPFMQPRALADMALGQPSGLNTTARQAAGPFEDLAAAGSGAPSIVGGLGVGTGAAGSGMSAAPGPFEDLGLVFDDQHAQGHTPTLLVDRLLRQAGGGSASGADLAAAQLQANQAGAAGSNPAGWADVAAQLHGSQGGAAADVGGSAAWAGLADQSHGSQRGAAAPVPAASPVDAQAYDFGFDLGLSANGTGMPTPLLDSLLGQPGGFNATGMLQAGAAVSGPAGLAGFANQQPGTQGGAAAAVSSFAAAAAAAPAAAPASSADMALDMLLGEQPGEVDATAGWAGLAGQQSGSLGGAAADLAMPLAGQQHQCNVFGMLPPMGPPEQAGQVDGGLWPQGDGTHIDTEMDMFLEQAFGAQGQAPEGQAPADPAPHPATGQLGPGSPAGPPLLPPLPPVGPAGLHPLPPPAQPSFSNLQPWPAAPAPPAAAVPPSQLPADHPGAADLQLLLPFPAGFPPPLSPGPADEQPWPPVPPGPPPPPAGLPPLPPAPFAAEAGPSGAANLPPLPPAGLALPPGPIQHEPHINADEPSDAALFAHFLREWVDVRGELLMSPAALHDRTIFAALALFMNEDDVGALSVNGRIRAVEAVLQKAMEYWMIDSDNASWILGYYTENAERIHPAALVF